MPKITLKKDQSIAQILGINLNSAPADEVLKQIIRRLELRQKTAVVTPNPEFMVLAQKKPWFGRLLNSADIAIPDGIGLVWAARFLGQPKLFRFHGADLAQKLFEVANLKAWQIGVIGARRGVIIERKKLLRRLKQKYPSAKISLLEEVPDWPKKSFEIIFACQGMGEQEKWIKNNLQSSRGLVYMGAGGSLDYLSGLVSRAPFWMRRAGLEWLYRLIRQPWRLTRQLALLKFVCLILKAGLDNYLGL